MAQLNQSLIDGILCLQEITLSKIPLSIKEISDRTSFNETKTRRMLLTLTHLGLVRKNDKNRFLSGSRIHILATQCLYGSPIITKALTILPSVKETCRIALGALWKDQVQYIYYKDPANKERNLVATHDLHNAETSSIGIMLLSYLSDDEVKDTLQDKFTNEVQEQISQARTNGFACCYNTIKDSYSIAVPVKEKNDITPSLALAFSYSYPLETHVFTEKISILKTLSSDITTLGV